MTQTPAEQTPQAACACCAGRQPAGKWRFRRIAALRIACLQAVSGGTRALHCIRRGSTQCDRTAWRHFAARGSL